MAASHGYKSTGVEYMSESVYELVAWTGRDGLVSPDARAYEEIVSEQKAEAKKRQLAALRPRVAAIPF